MSAINDSWISVRADAPGKEDDQAGRGDRSAPEQTQRISRAGTAAHPWRMQMRSVEIPLFASVADDNQHLAASSGNAVARPWQLSGDEERENVNKDSNEEDGSPAQSLDSSIHLTGSPTASSSAGSYDGDDFTTDDAAFADQTSEFIMPRTELDSLHGDAVLMASLTTLLNVDQRPPASNPAQIEPIGILPAEEVERRQQQQTSRKRTEASTATSSASTSQRSKSTMKKQQKQAETTSSSASSDAAATSRRRPAKRPKTPSLANQVYVYWTTFALAAGLLVGFGAGVAWKRYYDGFSTSSSLYYNDLVGGGYGTAPQISRKVCYNCGYAGYCY